MKPSEFYNVAVQHFEHIARAETRKWEGLQWYGDIENCDVCSRPMDNERFMIDGPAARGRSAPWGNLCVVCALKYSPSIGWGRGQLYEKSADDIWVLVSGGPPKEYDGEYF